MNKKRTNLLLPTSRGRTTGMCLLALTMSLFVRPAHSQEMKNEIPNNLEYNKEVRKGTWSIYAQSGLSWTTGTWYENINAKKSYGISPAIGGGIDFTIRPWVRIGTEYLYSYHRREQRFSSLNTSSMPIKAYGNYAMSYHNIKLNAGYNFMELWPQRKAQWLNIWASTGVGYMMAGGNEHGIYFNTSITQNGKSTPALHEININNNSNVEIHGNVHSSNNHLSFNKLYIPTSLHVEFDVSRQVTLGVKGEMDWILNKKSIAPKNLAPGMVTIRYNFVQSKAKKLKRHYDNTIAAMTANINSANNRAEAEKKRADEAEKACHHMEMEKADLQRHLEDCRQNKTKVVTKLEHTILFNNNSSYFSKEQAEALKAFAQQHKDQKLSLIAEASKPGSKRYNQMLSERRLKRVIDALLKMGFTADNLNPTIAIGSQRGIDSAEARRVTISVE